MRKLMVFAILACLLYASCKKDQNEFSSSFQSATDHQFLENARAKFDQISSIGTPDSSTPRSRSRKTPLWDKAAVKSFSFGKAVLVPLKYEKQILINNGFDHERMGLMDDYSQLLIYNDSKGTYHAEVITEFPDSDFVQNGRFSGFIKVENWKGNLLREFKYSKGNIRERSFNPPGTKIVSSLQLQVCYYSSQYVYAVDDPWDGVYSTEDLGCDNYFVDGGPGSASAVPTSADYGGVGSGASSGGSSTGILKVAAGKNPILDLQAYLKCYGIYPGATYSVTLCVDQPIAGQRTSYSSMNELGSSGFSVGHAFLEFTQNVGGVITQKAMGFYPSGVVTPVTPSSRGSLNDDSKHPYDVSLTINMSGSQFMTAMNTFASGDDAIYNLNTNNCVNWALLALSKAGYNISTNPGSWPFGGGDDPGDLGQDIRALSISQGMSRNMVGGNAPANQSSCN